MMGLLKYLVKRAPALAVIVVLLTGLLAAPASAASQAHLNREVASAKKAVAKNCNGLNVEPGQWVDKGSKRYGRQYVCLRHFSDRGADKTKVIMIHVPTNRVAGSSHKAIIKLDRDGYKVKTFDKTVTNQAYVVTFVVDYGQSGSTWGVKKLDGSDAKSDKQSISPLS